MLLAQSCDNRVTQPEETSEKPLLDIPAYGSAPLPQMTGEGLLTKTTKAISTKLPPAYHMLKKYTDENPDAPFVAILGVWDANQEHYTYRTIPLAFPDHILKKAQGKTTYYRYTLLEKDTSIRRNLAAFIPAVPEARNAMTRWLQVENRSKVVPVADNTNQNSGYDVAFSAAEGDGKSWPADYCDRVILPSGMPYYYNCDEGLVVTADKDESLDDSWPPSHTGGGDSSDDGIGNKDGYCPIGCGGGIGGTSAADAFENRIIDSELKPCMQSVMADLKEDYLGTFDDSNLGIGELIQKLAGKIPGYNWKMKDGELPDDINGRTYSQYDRQTGTVTTVFDTDKFKDATNIAVARTILHESIHAYVVATYYATSTFQERKALLGEDWYNAVGNKSEAHKYISDNFRAQIVNSLGLFAAMNGQIDLPSQFFEDMAWGGLTEYKNENKAIVEYQFFKDVIKDDSERKRIKNTIKIEQTGKDRNGRRKDQKGKDAGC